MIWPDHPKALAVAAAERTRMTKQRRLGLLLHAMNRSVFIQMGVVTAVGVTALARPAAADTAPAVKIVLQVPDGTIPLQQVIRARSEVTRIYRDAGVAIAWRCMGSNNCPADDVYSTQASGRRVTLVILSSTFTDKIAVATDALGSATGTPERRGQLAYVFYDRVESVARSYLNRGRIAGTYDMDTVLVLAHVMAHEVGHLLLPYGHSETGLMRGDWNAEDLRGAADGRLNFTAEQAALLRASLEPQSGASSADGL